MLFEEANVSYSQETDTTVEVLVEWEEAEFDVVSP